MEITEAYEVLGDEKKRQVRKGRACFGAFVFGGVD
jgi:DnaJ-class molecular chaperone